MDQIDEHAFKNAKRLPPLESEKKEELAELSEREFNQMLLDMDNPVMAQKRIAVQIKHFLDSKIKKEMEKGNLSDATRRWVESYNNILEKIQKALHGDKSVSLQIHKISHADIATKIRESNNI